jgi:cellulose biosynthesis protein BcsQ
MKTLAIVNNGGAGQAALAYHLSHMFSINGCKVLAVDLDPQANLSTFFLKEERLEELWSDEAHEGTIQGVLWPLISQKGDIAEPQVERISDGISLLVGDLGLSRFEDILAEAWGRCMTGESSAYKPMSAFYRAMLMSANKNNSDLVIIDIGPNLGPINRSALISADYILIPVGADLFSLQGLKNIGPTLRGWKESWSSLLKKNQNIGLPLPQAIMEPIGYVVLQNWMTLNRVGKLFGGWLDKIPSVFREAVLGESNKYKSFTGYDSYCLAVIKNYRSLMLMAMEARKPIFQLLPSDGAIGAHIYAVRDCYETFHGLVKQISSKLNLSIDGI